MIHISLRKIKIYQRRAKVEHIANQLGRPPTLSDFIPDKTAREEYLAECVSRQLDYLFRGSPHKKIPPTYN